jgi:uncharacterized protein YjbI with pentapeptide repeats
MANQNQLSQLKKGVESWNIWKEVHANELVDLSFADLSNADLKDAKLSNASLIGAKLSNAKLSDADLSHANLIHADLSDTDLSNTQLNDANLYCAILSGAILSGAILSGAILSGAILNNACLSGADLSDACLIDVKLKDAKLSHTNLIGANLSHADLSHADLNHVYLVKANLNEANLSYANLFETDLSYANLMHTNLEQVDWTNALIGWTQLDNLDLRTVHGLETVKHEGPSTIGMDTIYRSNGQIPEVFLRGAGVPETFITNMRALVESMSPIDFYSCFISYAHKDENFARRLHADLQQRGVRCWFASEDLKIGDHYHQRIDEAIRLYDKLILVLSEAAIRSAWVEREVVAAREKEDQEQREVLFPVRLDNTVLETKQAWAADVRRRWHIGDFTRWKEHDQYQNVLNQLIGDLCLGDDSM